MYQFILFIHVFAAACIVALVLVQQGKGASVGAAFGSGASQTIFGSRGSGSFLFRVTFTFITIFFITSIALNYLVVQAYKHERVITLPVPKTAPAQAPANNAGTTAPTTTEQSLPSEIPTRQ